jgi:hypothetical protein
VDIFDSDYRRQYCRERSANVRDEYQGAQASPRASERRERRIAQMRSMWDRIRRQQAQRAPAYRS